MKHLALLSIFVLAGLIATAQQTLTIPYQALVRDASGNPLPNKQIGAEISLLQDSITAVPFFTETHTPTTNPFGQMDLQIGSVDTTAFDAIDWSAGKMFIRLEVDITGGTAYQIIATHQLLAVPFAKYAEEAAGWKNTESGLINNAEKIIIGNENANSQLEFSGGFNFSNTSDISTNDQEVEDLNIYNDLNDTSYIYGYTKGLRVKSSLRPSSTIGAPGSTRYNQAIYGMAEIQGVIYGNSYGVYGVSYAHSSNSTIYGNSISVYGQGANLGHVTGDLVGVYGSVYQTGGIVDGNRWAVYSNGNLYATNLKSRTDYYESFLRNRKSAQTQPLFDNSLDEVKTLFEKDTIIDLGKMDIFLLEKIDQLIQNNIQHQKEIELLKSEIENINNK